MKVAVRIEFTLEAPDVFSALETVEESLKSAPRPAGLLDVRPVGASPVAPVIYGRVVTEELATMDRVG